MKYQFFPRSIGVTPAIAEVIQCFELIFDKIDSARNNLRSNEVLMALAPYLTEKGFRVELGKRTEHKIPVPVLYGQNNTIDKHYLADALSLDGKIVIEVEAGRATENNQFLKNIFQASLMFGVEYLVMAVRTTYRGHADYEIVYTFLETLYISNR